MSIPLPDKNDINKEVPLVNGGIVLDLSIRRQAEAEYTQQCYIRLRQQEETRIMFNYLDPSLNPAFAAFLTSNKIDPKKLSMSANAPNEALEDIMD